MTKIYIEIKEKQNWHKESKNLKKLSDVLYFVLNHPERKEKFKVFVIRQADWCNVDNPDGSDPIPLMYTTFGFSGELGVLVEDAFSLFEVENKDDGMFNLTIETEGEYCLDEEKYLNSDMEYKEFVISILNNFNIGNVLDFVINEHVE